MNTLIGDMIRENIKVVQYCKGLRKVYVITDNDFITLARNTNNNNRKRSMLIGTRYRCPLRLMMSRCDDMLSVFIRFDGKVKKGKPIFIGNLNYRHAIANGFHINKPMVEIMKSAARCSGNLLKINPKGDVIIYDRYSSSETEDSKHTTIFSNGWEPYKRKSISF